MGEYADSVRTNAAAALLEITRQTAPRENDPIPMLIAHLLEVRTDDCPASPEDFVATDDWVTWNRLIATRPRAMRAAITATLEWERPSLPKEIARMQVWGARLVLGTLDRLALK